MDDGMESMEMKIDLMQAAKCTVNRAATMMKTLVFTVMMMMTTMMIADKINRLKSNKRRSWMSLTFAGSIARFSRERMPL